MGIPSSMSEHIYQLEGDFPAPSDKDKLNKGIEHARQLIGRFPDRLDIIEEKFHLADLFMGRGNPGDAEAAKNLYHEILNRGAHPYLKARTLIGLAELSVPFRNETTNALELCAEAEKILNRLTKEEKKIGSFSFFLAKVYVIEADLRITRDEPGDHQKSLKLHEKIIADRQAHWYFRGRSLLGKAELILYHYWPKISEGITLSKRAYNLLKHRPEDYFTVKSPLIEAECLIQRGKDADYPEAQKVLKEIIKHHNGFNDLLARAKLDLAEIQKIPQAQKLLQQVQEMEGLDPYIIQKISLLKAKLKEMK